MKPMKDILNQKSGSGILKGLKHPSAFYRQNSAVPDPPIFLNLKTSLFKKEQNNKSFPKRVAKKAK